MASPGRQQGRKAARLARAALGAVAAAAGRKAVAVLGGRERTRVVVALACVLGLSGADTATVGASATELRHAFAITNTDIGLLVTVTSLVAAVATLPFGVLADRVRRTWTLAAVIVLWGVAMLWSASTSTFGMLLVARLVLGAVTAAAGPIVASLVGDYFQPSERGRIYGYVLAGELVGVGVGFAVTGDIAALSWRAAFVVLALPAFALAWFVAHLPEPLRGGRGALIPEGGQRETDPATPSRTDAQALAAEQGIRADPATVLAGGRRRLGFRDAVRYVLSVRTNVILIAASACAYYFLAGVETFGLEFAKEQYRVGQVLATGALLVVGIGAVAGVIVGGALGDRLLRWRLLRARVLTGAVAATAAFLLFIPPLFTRELAPAIGWLSAAAFALSAQNPPLDAARLDIMPSFLWGRAESVRTMLRSLAQALAPVLFGAVSDVVFGGGRTGLRWTFVVMLVPLAASALLLFRALRTYPRDVASAAGS